MQHLNAVLVAAALAVTSLAACSQPAAPPPPAHEGASHGAMEESPEAAGGEDASFALRLALLEGHLMVGRELIEANQARNATPHFGHPARELYGDIGPVVEKRGGVQFQKELVVLEATASAAPNSPEFRTRYDAAMAKAREARALIPAELQASDDFQLRLVSDIATVASQEYRNAIVAGKIGSLIEYHDTRGFIEYAQALLKARASSDNPKIKEATAIVDKLMTFVAPLMPPETPIATDAQFEAEVTRLRDLQKTTP